MKRKLWNKKTIFLILFILGLFSIFFVWREFNPELWSRSFILTTDGVQHFRKWLDVSGWTKLVFKISYDKYEQVYEGAELLSVKKMIENIILKNIDNRISWLWVSDYRAYVQSMDNTPYIVVEIGGIADLDQAKDIIGKTVELEFRLPNEVEPTAAYKQARKQLAQDLKNEIENNGWMIDKFADAKWAENIYYDHWSGVTLGQLPEVYKNNAKLLTNATIGSISNIVSDTYDVVEYRDQSGSVQSTEMYGYTFYRVNDIKETTRDTATVNDVVDVAEQLAYVYDTKMEKWLAEGINTYDYVDGNLVYNLWAVAEWQAAYDIKIVQVAGESMLGASSGDIQDAVDRKAEMLLSVKDTIKTKESFDGADIVADGWIDIEQLKSLIPSFDENNIEEVVTYTELVTNYVVYVRDSKLENEDLLSKLIVQNVNKDQFEKLMTSKVLYDIESVFVQDRETWKIAKSKNGDILNGAYFKYANTSQDQVWKPVVAINFDDKGTTIFCDITSDNIGNQMAIFVWWDMLTSPVIRSKICGWTAQIDGGFTMDSAKELVDALNDGALPAPLVLMQEEKISPTLWASALTWALIAAWVGILAIFVFMFIMYGWRQALVTLSVLVSFMVILWLFMKFVDYALSLSGIAAVILSIGMAVDANILIYERMKEEEAKWKTRDSAIDTAYDRSRPAIRDGNISTGLIALLLFMLGSNMFKGFGTMLMVTVWLTLLVNVPLTRMLLKWFYRK